jgi:hypothetical protein
MAYKLVVTTTRDASILLEIRMTNGDPFRPGPHIPFALHRNNYEVPSALIWGALIVDEATQVSEVELICALSVVTPPREYSIAS